MPLRSKQVHYLKPLLAKAMHADRIRVLRKMKRVQHLLQRKDSKQEAIAEQIKILEKQLIRSAEKKIRRMQNTPQVTYKQHLPITSKKDDIIRAISEHQIVIVSGDTGSGKTTQLPKFCLAAGRGLDGMIGCTQPRRIAATTVANRIAEEMGQKIGDSVGYKIRFHDKTGDNTLIKIMTDGILLAETQIDPYLNDYDTIIVDEAHERSLNIDFILGILITLLHKRKDLKLIITSATIDTRKFSQAFDEAPVIEVSGRMYPVEMRYQPEQRSRAEEADPSYVELCVQAVEKLTRADPRGDILVFMPTEQDIRETCELLEGRKYKDLTVLPLFARLSATEQKRVFARRGKRKIIVATNIAETSITIPGIKYVVDTGLARISQYMPKSRITALPILPISRSSADQRKGRCGRIENGVCIRLYSEDDYLKRPRFTKPEILRSNLAEVILKMMFLRLGSLQEFPFIDRPTEKSIRDGFNLLQELGAIRKRSGRPSGKKAPKKTENIQNDESIPPRTSTESPAKTDEDPAAWPGQFELTPVGKLMAKIPMDPRLSRMIIEADRLGCLEQIAVIASALSIQDPRERPIENEPAADEAQARFVDPHSDFNTLLNIWAAYRKIFTPKMNFGRLRKFCRAHFLSFRRMREWHDIYSQISIIIQDNGLKTDEFRKPQAVLDERMFDPHYTAVHQSILSGFLSNIAHKKEKQHFTAAKGREVMIFPGSGLFKNPTDWIVAAEMVQTSRLFARTVAAIDIAWLEEIGRDQCRYTYLNPRWSAKRGEVVADEQVGLFGLVIVPGRLISYGKINPDQAGEIFIRDALLPGDLPQRFAFLKHNLRLANDIRGMEDRIRRRDILVDAEEMLRFYRKHLVDVYDLGRLDRFVKKKNGDRILQWEQADLMRYSPEAEELALYPKAVVLGNDIYACTYRFDPGKADDGVTITIPVEKASNLDFELLEWIIPGMITEKVTTLIKGLPKKYRKDLVPLSSALDVLQRYITELKGPAASALSRFFHYRMGVDIPASVWPVEALPDHLKVRIAVVDAEQNILFSSREPSFLKSRLATQKDPVALDSAKKTWEKTNINAWDFGDLPDVVKLQGEKGMEWIMYPGLEAVGNQVNLRLFANRKTALASHKKGVVKLFSHFFAKDLRFLKQNLALPKILEQQSTYFGGRAHIERQLYQCVLRDLFSLDIRKQTDFSTHAQAMAGQGLLLKGQSRLKTVRQILECYHQALTDIGRLETTDPVNPLVRRFLDDRRAELARLVPRNFVLLYDEERMSHMTRYVKALSIRAQRGSVNFEKDRSREEKLQRFTSILSDFINGLRPETTPQKRKAIEDFFWLIEEYKVSLFAQELKTAVSVSNRKLLQKAEQIRRMI